MKSLRNVLLINAVSSGITGLGLIAFAPVIATLFGTSSVAAIWGTGLFLLLFAIEVGLESRRNPLIPARIRLIVVMDVTWVVVSLLIVLFQLFDLSSIGYLAIGAVALWVAAMAYLQNRGLQQLRITHA